MVYKLYKEQQLNCDVATAWDFFSSPANLSRITPEEMKFKIWSGIQQGNIFNGMVIDYYVSPVLGIPLKWQTLIEEVIINKRFTDIQLKGPYKYWKHIHEFIPNAQGVLMKDTVEYELPMSVVGSVVHKLFVRKKLEQIFDYRKRVCRSLFNPQNNAG